MDKRVVFAVAGSGKTSSIIDKITNDSRCLVITYTDNNTRNLRNRIIQKLGKLPEGVRVYSYFTFLYSFCYRPLCGYKLKTKGLNFNYPLPKDAQRTKKDCKKHYIDKHNRLFASRVAKLMIEFSIVEEVIKRIEKFFDLVCVDEVQDFAANDFNFLCRLAASNAGMILVGDFHQHTFDTSKDGNTRKSLYDDFNKYCKELEKAGYAIDLSSLSHSFRCSPNVCLFVQERLGIEIQSHRQDETDIKFIEDEEEVEAIYSDETIVKLFYQKSSAYAGNTENWGNTKGLDHYQDVCIVLNPNTLKAYHAGDLKQLPSTTKNKLYVACTRARGRLYLISESQLKKVIKKIN